MPRVVGIDPGTTSLDLVGLDDGAIFLEHSSSKPRADDVVAVLRNAGPLDLVSGPSGYGLPLIPIDSIGSRELRLMLLADPGERTGVPGLRALVDGLREARLPVVFLPGVIHLASVPAHRKVNRVDMGTADKLAVAACAIDDQARHLGCRWDETSFVLVELGGAFSAVLTVESGRVIDGQGGSSGPLGYRAAGALDGEAACLVSPITKSTVFTGGLADIAEHGGDPLAMRAFVESVQKAVAGAATLTSPREVVLSGRLSRVAAFSGPLARALERFGPVRILAPAAAIKEAAHGAAILADGLAGGRYAGLVETLQLRSASGTALDHLLLHGAEKARHAWLASAS